MAFAKRYGFKRKPKLSEAKINEVIRALRVECLASATANRKAPSVRGDSNPNWVPTSRVSGGLSGPPAELSHIDYLAEEKELRIAVNPSSAPFGAGLPQDENSSLGQVCTDALPDTDDPKLAETRKVLESMDKDCSLQCLKGQPAHLATFLRAAVMRGKFEEKGGTTEESLNRAIDTAINCGLPTWKEEDECFVASRSRVGNSIREVTPSDSEHVVFDCPRKLGKIVIGSVIARGHTWRVVDFGDTIPEVVGGPIGDLYGRSLTERNKCLLIHLASAGLCTIGDTDESLGNKFLEVMSVARNLRVDQYRQAQECGEELGEPASNDPIIVDELRSHVHDVLNPNHGRDHKTLLCFPVGVIEKKNVCLIRVTPSCLFSIHVTQPIQSSKEWVFPISFQDHMRLVLPPSYLIGVKLSDSPRTLSQPRGWRNFLQFESHNSVWVGAKVLGRCPTCQATSIRLPLGVEGALVGRSMIPDEAQLRCFRIEKPWAKRAAEEVGQDAVMAWEQERDTPPLDEPPKLSQPAQVALGELFEVIPGPKEPCSMKKWQEIASRSDHLVGIVGDVFLASHAYMARWRATREPTTMAPAGLKVFQGLVGDEIFDYAMDMATFGVKPKGHYPPVRARQQAYAIANDDPTTTASELWSDIVSGRLFLLSSDSEHATGNLMESKLTFVTQDDVANHGCTKTRYISDPRVAANERVFGENRPACIVPRHQHVARRLMLCKRRYPGIPVLLSKRDVKSAFKLVPIAVCGLPYMGCRFGNFICIYLALFFGWRPSPANLGGGRHPVDAVHRISQAEA